MRQVWIVGGLVVASLALGTLIVKGRDLFGPDTPGASRIAEPAGLPWQIDVLPHGASRVMGLTLAMDASGSRLQQAMDQWGNNMEIAIVAAPGEDGTLEAFVDPASAGFISGKAVITLRVPVPDLRVMRARAVKSAYMESTTRKYTLAPADLQQARQAPIQSIGFIPQANLDEATVLARFGAPEARLRSNGHLEHFLYPTKGLDLALDSEGKELLQYVPPGAFDTLSRPLQTPFTASQPQSAR